MHFTKKNITAPIFLAITLLFFFASSCKEEIESPIVEEPQNTSNLVEGVDYFLPHISLNNWKVTLPIGSPTEVKPPDINNYGTNNLLKDFMYNDSTDGSLVFYTFPNTTTNNTSFSRTELRERMVPTSDNTNWTFAQGGRMKGTLSLPEISSDNNGNPHRTIIMQIHGRLTNVQKIILNTDDNNAPPILKIYWQRGRVRVLTKILKDLNDSDIEILETDAWEDDGGFYFDEVVDNEKFTLEVIASEGRLEVILNDNESKVYENIHMERWGVFENYFKAGNYLQTTDDNAFATVKYYDLIVEH